MFYPIKRNKKNPAKIALNGILNTELENKKLTHKAQFFSQLLSILKFNFNQIDAIWQ
jgi:hypothetical protein